MAKLDFNFTAILLLSLASAALASDDLLSDFLSVANAPIESTLSKLDEAAGGDEDKLTCLKLLANTSHDNKCINFIVDGLLGGYISYRMIAYSPGCCKAFRKIDAMNSEGISKNCMEKVTGYIPGEVDRLFLSMGCAHQRQ